MAKDIYVIELAVPGQLTGRVIKTQTDLSKFAVVLEQPQKFIEVTELWSEKPAWINVSYIISYWKI